MACSLLHLTESPLEPGALSEAVAARHAELAASTQQPGPGGITSFLGIVRGENQGRRVTRLEYEAYIPLALKSFERIVAEVDGNWASVALGIHHRLGSLAVGEISVVIVAASAHRGDAFAACRYAIERLKQIAPIWKREHSEGGETWLEGAVADPDDQDARQEAYRRACV